MDMRQRVQQLIDTYFDGVVDRAAKTWAVPQSTLQRLASGKTMQPRADVLLRIAQAHGTTIEWLMRGIGQPPNPVISEPYLRSNEWRQFVSLVESLGVEPRLEELLTNLPLTPATFVKQVTLGKAFDQRVLAASRTAERLSSRAWLALFRSVIDAQGIDAVRGRLHEAFAIQLLARDLPKTVSA